MNPGQIVTVNSRGYDGAIRKSWSCEFSVQRGSMILLTGKFDADVSHPELGHIKGGTLTEEYFWFDRWYNVFRFDEPDGTFRNYYCNICMPPTLSNGVLDYVDLDLDVVVWPDGTLKVLDEDDFESNITRYGYPSEVCDTARAALQEVIASALEGKLPIP